MQKKTLKKVSSLALGSSMFLMGMLPFGSAFAASNPMVSNMMLTESGNTFTASASDPTGTAEYSFWVETPSGRWYQAQGYSTSNTFTLMATSSGTYHVQAYALDMSQVQAGDWSLGVASSVDSYSPTGSVTALTASASTSTATIGQTVTITGSATVTGGEPIYDFWVESPNGTWTQPQGYSTSASYALPIAQSGTYIVDVYALDSSQAGEYSLAQESTVTVTVGSPTVSAALVYGQNQTLSNNGSIPEGDAVTIMPSATGLTNPMYQVWIEWPNGSWTKDFGYAPAPANGITIPTPMEGTYTINVYATNGAAPGVNPVMASYVFSAFGEATTVQLSASSPTLVADGMNSDTITVKVEDASGNVVTNFNGSVTLTAPTGMTLGGVSSVDTVTVSGGIASVTVTAATTITGSETITASSLSTTNGQAMASTITYASTTVTVQSAVIHGVSVSPTFTDVSVNSSSPDTMTLQLVDQAGNPMPAGSTGGAVVNLTISGPASFAQNSSPNNPVLTDTVGVVAGAPTTVNVYSIQGDPGLVTVAATGTDLVGSATSIDAVVATQATMLAVTQGTVSYTTTSGLFSFPISTTTVAAPSGQAYTDYTVTLEDSQGQPLLFSGTAGSLVSGLTVTIPSGETNVYLASVNASGVPTGTLVSSTSSTSATVSATLLANGEAEFAVLNTTMPSSPTLVPLTVSYNGITQTATYAYVVSQPASLTFMPASATLESGASATYTVQVSDAWGNPVSDSGVSVTLNVTPSSLATFANSATSMTVVTGANGAATFTVDADTVTAVGTATVSATASALTGTQTLTVVPPANYVTMLSTSGVTSATVNAGVENSSAVRVYEDNGVLLPVTGTDNLTITSSNPSVVLLSATATGTMTVSATSVSSSGYAIPIWGVEPGTATITISDSSDPSVAPITVTVTVSATALPSANISPAISTSPTMTSSVAYFDLNGMTETAYSATTINEIGSANSGTVVINTPMLETAVATPTGAVSSSTITPGDTLAVWQSNGSYYYIDLSQELNSSNLTSGTVGITISSTVSATVSVFAPGTLSVTTSGSTATLDVTLATNSGTLADQSWQLASPGQSTYVITGATANSNYLNVTLY